MIQQINIKNFFTLKDVSTYRSELMGLAIIWIMMLHFTFIQIKPLGFIAQYGFAGVDIFMFVSGFGLFFSLDKNDNVLKFYKKRFLRIFPTYYLLGIFASLLLYHDDVLTYLFRYSTIGFWSGGAYGEWFIPSIILLYFITPGIKRILDHHKNYLIISFILIPFFVSYILVSNDLITKGEPHFFLLYRIPAFILGQTCANWIKNNISIKFYYYILFLGVIIFVFLYPNHHKIFNYKYLSLAFLLPLFIFCLTVFSKKIYYFNPLLSAIGKASLEIYIIQGIFFHAITTKMFIIPEDYHDIIVIFLIILASILGLVFNRLINEIGINRLF